MIRTSKSPGSMEGSDSSSASVGMRGTSLDSVRMAACSTGACSEMMIGISTCRQRCGGEIAWGIGELPVLALAIGVAVAWRASDARESRRKDRQAERDDDAELKAYNAMLERYREVDERS